jgi:hypothetical protein
MPFAGDTKLMVQVNFSAGELVTMGATIDTSGNIILFTNQPIEERVLVSGGYNGEVGSTTSAVRYKYTFSVADWQGDAGDYSITIQAAELPFGGLRDIIVQRYDSSGNGVNIGSSITPEDNVIMHSTNSFDDKLLMIKIGF